MKKTIFVLPLCLIFAFCSSSKKATTPPAGPGISNVNVKRGDTMTSAATASASFTPADRDWSYKASHDTTLNGTWTLDGMMAANGSWSSTQSWYKDTTATAATTDTTSMMANTDTTGTSMSSATSTTSTSVKAGRRTRGKGANRRALYDSAQKRLAYDYKSTSTLDTTAQPFQYWKRIPTLTINAARQVFSGNTGCNSMSGSFHFTDKDIQFSRNIVTSKMACNEYDEATFLAALKKADSYTLTGNTLEIKQGGTTLLTFKKS